MSSRRRRRRRRRSQSERQLRRAQRQVRAADLARGGPPTSALAPPRPSEFRTVSTGRLAVETAAALVVIAWMTFAAGVASAAGLAGAELVAGQLRFGAYLTSLVATVFIGLRPRKVVAALTPIGAAYALGMQAAPRLVAEAPGARALVEASLGSAKPLVILPALWLLRCAWHWSAPARPEDAPWVPLVRGAAVGVAALAAGVVLGLPWANGGLHRPLGPSYETPLCFAALAALVVAQERREGHALSAFAGFVVAAAVAIVTALLLGEIAYQDVAFRPALVAAQVPALVGFGAATATWLATLETARDRAARLAADPGRRRGQGRLPARREEETDARSRTRRRGRAQRRARARQRELDSARDQGLARRETADAIRGTPAAAPGSPLPEGVAFLPEVASPRAAVAVECAYCGDGLAAGVGVACVRCDTPLHRDCWSENRGCATFSCGSKKHRPRA